MLYVGFDIWCCRFGVVCWCDEFGCVKGGSVKWFGNGGFGGASNVGNWPGGGGGAGYYGGGGGNQGYSGGGGGGSNYVGGLTASTSSQGSHGSGTAMKFPPNTSDSDYVSGVGTADNNVAGGNGLVILTWS